MYTLVPSLPASSFTQLSALSDALDGVAPELQVDIVDGQFVPHISWPFTEDNPAEALKELGALPHKDALEIDCMILNPEEYLDAFAQLGVSRVIVHVGSTEAYDDIIAHAHEHKYRIGLAFTNDISLDALRALVPLFDFVQVMGIREVGAQGQSFDERTLDTVRALRMEYPSLEIAVDGSVNTETLPLLREAGANRFAPGSAISQAQNPAKAYQALKSLL